MVAGVTPCFFMSFRISLSAALLTRPFRDSLVFDGWTDLDWILSQAVRLLPVISANGKALGRRPGHSLFNLTR